MFSNLYRLVTRTYIKEYLHILYRKWVVLLQFVNIIYKKQDVENVVVRRIAFTTNVKIDVENVVGRHIVCTVKKKMIVLNVVERLFVNMENVDVDALNVKVLPYVNIIK